MKKFNLGDPDVPRARNRCCECAAEWHDRPVGFARRAACPACGSLYWEWLNYIEGPPGTRDVAN